MKLTKLNHDPAALAEFFQEGLESLGAICERTWYDRLQVVAEGRAAKLWQSGGELLEAEVAFPPADTTGPRDSAKEVYPGCPLTFQLADTLCPRPMVLQRVILQFGVQSKAPAHDVAEKLWRAQMPGTVRWSLETPFQTDWRFSLLALARCEIQAIDQHWSLHRLVISLPEGTRDDALARELELGTVAARPAYPIEWPAPNPAAWHPLLRAALREELESDLAAIRQRQENYLRRELDRVDDYFLGYAEELKTRLRRQLKEQSKGKLEDRLAAAKSEHERRRQDQVQRHEIRVVPHLDALLLLAEPAWRATVGTIARNETRITPARFVPRSRQWLV